MRMFVFTIIGICKDSRERTKMILPRSRWVQGDLPVFTCLSRLVVVLSLQRCTFQQGLVDGMTALLEHVPVLGL